MPLDLLPTDTVTNPAPHLCATTPSEVVYATIAAELRSRPREMGEALPLIAQASRMPLRHLEQAAGCIAELKALTPPGPVEALVIDALIRCFAHGLHLKVGDGGAVYRFAQSHWAREPDAELRRALTRLALQNPDRYGPPSAVTRPALSLLKDMAPRLDNLLTAPPAPCVNVRNGELWVDDEGEVELRPHWPETGMRFVLPLEYEPAAACPQFDAALDEITSRADNPPELRRHILELFGYALQGRRDIPVIVYFWGGGANGKSLLLNVLRALAGEKQVFAGTLTTLVRDRFTLPSLAGKLLFVEDDALDGARVETSLLKLVSENKAIDARRAHAREATSFLSMVLPVIATNGAPEFTDTSEGLRRRLHVIPFDRHFAAAEIDPELGRRIIESELPGVLNRAIAGLARLRRRGSFALPEDCLRASAAFLGEANPVVAFIQERCIQDADARVSLDALYRAYALWRKETGSKRDLDKSRLKGRLVAMGYAAKKSSYMVVEGLALRNLG
jgi:putative DNA primase/helicase